MDLRVTQVMLSSGFGGAERLFVDLCLSLADAGTPVQAICQPGFQGIDPLAGHPAITVAPIKVSGNWDLFATRKMHKSLSAFRPAVIHSHLARGALYAGRCSRPLAIPLVANLHNYVDLKYYRQVDCFLPGTADQRRYLLAQGIADERIRVVPHFTRIAAVDRPAAAATGHFVSYGRMVAKKGFDVLLRAFAHSHARQPDMRLLLGGDGPERAALERLALSLGIRDAVEFSGWIDDAAAFLDRGDTFILPSLDEPFGIVLLEAMARGKAMIVTRTAGPLEVFDEDQARLVDIGDEQGLATAMEELFLDHELRQRLATASWQHFMAHFSEARVMPVFIDVYRSLLPACPGQQDGGRS